MSRQELMVLLLPLLQLHRLLEMRTRGRHHWRRGWRRLGCRREAIGCGAHGKQVEGAEAG